MAPPLGEHIAALYQVVMTTAPAPPPPLPARIDFLDVARGIALIAMFVFHFSWDLVFTGFSHADITGDLRWILFARLIAGSFLTIMGASLVLATRNGIRWRAFLIRLGVIAGAAAAVTIGTRLFLPDNYIFFGILHHIALASLLGLAFLRLPLVAVVLVAILCFAAPLAIHDARFNSGLGLIVGLGTVFPETLDYVPIFHWFGCVLLGIIVARLLLSHAPEGAWRRWRASSALTRLIAWGGRHSLPIYLTHQLVFLGLLMGVAWLLTPSQTELAAETFFAECHFACQQANHTENACRSACSCAADALKRENLWRRAILNELTADEEARVRTVAGACVAP